MILRLVFLAALLAAPLAAAPAHAPSGPDSTAVPASAADTLAFPDRRARAWQTGMLRADRLQHASLAFGIGCGAGLLTRRAEVGAGVALTLGVAKELLDDRFDGGDLVADALGAALAALAVAALERGGGR